MPKQDRSGSPDERTSAIERVAACAAELREREARLAELVAAARAAGATWQDVAGALGVTRSAAHQRFHR